MADFPYESFRLNGEPGGIRSSATKWSTFGNAASDAAGHIRSLDTSLFIGPEGDQYRDGLKDSLPPHLDTTGQAYNKVASALTTFADELSHLQDRMRPIAAKAPSLWDALQAAQGRVSSAKTADKEHDQQVQTDAATRPPDQPAPPDTYHSDMSAASASLTQAQQQWNDCLNAANQVKTDHHTAVDKCERAINDAADMRFAHNPHGWGALWQGFKDFVKDHAAGLAKLSGILKVVSGICGVLSFIPVLNFVMAPLAVITGAAALAIDVSIYAATGRGSLTSIIVDGALLALPGVGKLASMGLKGLRGAKAAEAMEGAARAGNSSLRNSASLRAPDGVVYRRVDLNGAKPYIGQAKNAERFAARQAEHARANPDADFEFTEIGRADPGVELDRLEEYYIRQEGGPTNRSNPEGLLANKRHQMSETRYMEAGGDPR